MTTTSTPEAPSEARPAASAAAAPAAGTVAGSTAASGSTAGTAAPQHGRRLALLDGLRLLAAVAVVLYHYTAWHHGFWGVEPAKNAWPQLSRSSLFGNMGVQLFFVISGFVILLSSYGKRASQFIGSRIGRLYPAYWVAVVTTGVLVFFIWPEMGSKLTFTDWAANLTMMQGGLGNPHIDGVYWTLWAEMRFYALVLVLMLLGWQTPRKLLAFAAIWPVAALAAPLVPSNFIRQALVPEYAPLFAGGMCLFLLYRFGHTPLRWLVLVLNVALSAHHTGITGSREAMELVGYEVPQFVYWAIIVGIFAAIALLSLTPLRNVNVPGMALAGALTYPVYLLHEMWGWWLIDQLSPILPRPAVLGIVMAVVGVAAYLVHRLVEQRYGRALGKCVTAGLDRVAAFRAPARSFADRVSRGRIDTVPATRLLPENPGGITRGR